jgi:hypothetical protein
MNEPDDSAPERATFLPLMLATLGTGFFFLVLLVLTGGLIFYVGCTVAGLVFLGLIHYTLWGKTMSEQVGGEREEMELLDRAREEQRQKWTFRR